MGNRLSPWDLDVQISVFVFRDVRKWTFGCARTTRSIDELSIISNYENVTVFVKEYKSLSRKTMRRARWAGAVTENRSPFCAKNKSLPTGRPTEQRSLIAISTLFFSQSLFIHLCLISKSKPNEMHFTDRCFRKIV